MWVKPFYFHALTWMCGSVQTNFLTNLWVDFVNDSWQKLIACYIVLSAKQKKSEIVESYSCVRRWLSILQSLYIWFTGACLVGWSKTESNKCYRYYGGIATYSEAVTICALEKAVIVRPDNRFWIEIGKVVRFSQQVRICRFMIITINYHGIVYCHWFVI